MLKSNIIIAGVSRAGKSTISRMLSGKFGYQHISMDSINHGFEKVFPELGINTYADMSLYSEQISGIFHIYFSPWIWAGEGKFFAITAKQNLASI